MQSSSATHQADNLLMSMQEHEYSEKKASIFYLEQAVDIISQIATQLNRWIDSYSIIAHFLLSVGLSVFEPANMSDMPHCLLII